MKRLLLAGGGHAHMAVLHALGRERISEVEVTLVAPTPRWVQRNDVLGRLARRVTKKLKIGRGRKIDYWLDRSWDF